jgi:hypothetical protein
MLLGHSAKGRQQIDRTWKDGKKEGRKEGIKEPQLLQT